MPIEIDPGAHKHGVPDTDMLHALRHHWRAYETDDEAVLMVIGPSGTGAPLEIGILFDVDAVAVIHAMPARSKFLEGWPA